MKQGDEKFTNLFKTVMDAKASVDDKVNQEAVHRIHEKFENYSTHEQLKVLYSKVLPPLKVVQDKETSLEEEFIRLRQVVDRFDEVLNSKSSKFSLEKLEEKVAKLPIKQDIEAVRNSNEK